MISNLLMHLFLLTTLSASSRYQVLSLVSSTIRNHSSLLCSLSSTRRSFIANTLPTLQMATTSRYSPTPTSVNQAVQLLDSVYGPVTSNDFPLPMRPYEAGPCKDKEQRRYLWTDAFAVMAYQSLAEYYNAQSNIDEAKIYQTAVDKLINVVHSCLGKPRSENDEDGMTPCEISPSKYVGLRIGKEESRKVTDYGMDYDGMYWHYVDKWLFALARTGHVEEGIRIAKSCFPYFYSSSKYGGGIRWKLSVDATPPPSLQNVHGPNDDTLNALIVFSMLEEQNKSNELNLKDEIATLQSSLTNYRPRVTNDPLGWGLEAVSDQFVMGNPRKSQLQRLAGEALDTRHLSLPFRLYGALIGALVAETPTKHTREVLDVSVKYELEEMSKESSTLKRYEEEHRSINRVMLAMALLSPGVLGRRASDPMVQL